MTLEQWFAKSEKNVQALYDSRNGHRYCYKRGQKLSKTAKKLIVEQEVDLIDGCGKGAWLYKI